MKTINDRRKSEGRKSYLASISNNRGVYGLRLPSFILGDNMFDKKAYHKKYREEHKEKIKIYRQMHKEEHKLHNKQWYQELKDFFESGDFSSF